MTVALDVDCVRAWDDLVARGYRFEPWHGDGLPYPTLEHARHDLDVNRWLWYVPVKSVDLTPAAKGEAVSEWPVSVDTWVLVDYRQNYGHTERRVLRLVDVQGVVATVTTAGISCQVMY